MFIRFVVGADGQYHRELNGIVTEARLLRDRGLLSNDESARLEESYEWLNEHLPVPPFESSAWPREAVAWFKDDAHESVRCMWAIVALLEEHGQPVQLLRSNNPGRVLYEDEHQIVVDEWKRI